MGALLGPGGIAEGDGGVRSVIPRFALVRPRSMGEALEIRDGLGDDAAWYAGGTELLQVMKMGLAQFGTLVDLKGIDELRGIARGPDGRLTIGAATTHRDIERSEVVRDAAPALARLAATLANVRVRNHGTIGGNLSFAEPHSDPATFLLACDARVRLRGRAGDRALSIDEFIVGSFATVRASDELVVAIEVPPAAPSEGRAYEKARFRERPAVSVAVRLRVDAGTVVEVSIAVGSMTDCPTRVPVAEQAIVGAAADSDALEARLADARVAMADLDAVDDLDGSADYKRHLAGVLLARAARGAFAEATARA